MPNSNSSIHPDSALALRCPKCEHGAAQFVVASKSVATVRCASCGHPWSLEIAMLPAETQRQLQRLTTA